MIRILKNDWVLKFGAPKIVHSDCGRTFSGKEMANFAKECGFVLEFSSPYHHSSSGLIERQFRTIRDALMTKMSESRSKDWAECLPEVEYVLNATHQKTINMSPAEAVFGRRLRRMNMSSQKTNFNVKETRRAFSIGDRVLVKKEMSNKNENRYEGPATVEEVLHPRAYGVKFDDGRRLRRNIEWLKFFKTTGV